MITVESISLDSIATYPEWLPGGQKIEDPLSMLTSYGYRVAASDTLQHSTADFRDYLFLAQ